MKYTERAIFALNEALKIAAIRKLSSVDCDDLLAGLAAEGIGMAAKCLLEHGAGFNQIREAMLQLDKVENQPIAQPSWSSSQATYKPMSKRALELAAREATDRGKELISTEHILLGLMGDPRNRACRVLANLNISTDNIRKSITQMVLSTKNSGEKPRGNSKTPVLDEFCRNLTDLAAKGELDPVIGREQEIARVIQILSRRGKNNPILIGEPGVGKTAIAEGLAQRIVAGQVPRKLKDMRVCSLDLGNMVAGTKYRGEFEDRLKKLLDEVRIAEDVILVIDEVHTLIGAGSAEGSMDAANLMKPALGRGELQCIGATTLDEYKKRIERDAALSRRFLPVMVEPPTVAQTIDILTGLREKFEDYHQVKISDEAIAAAATLSDRYINDRFLPDKAIDLIDEAGPLVGAASEEGGELPVMIAEHIASVVAVWTGVPVSKLSESDTDKLIRLPEILHQRIIGQQEAIDGVTRAVRQSRAGLSEPNRPLASFIFAGPTGVGKTELTKALTSFLFDSEERMIRLDMSEYMEKHSVSRMIGSPPGYIGYDEGGQLTEAVRRHPYSVLLFDEIEKAHPDVFNLLLQVLEDGRLTDSRGRTVDFKNCLIIMTTNIGSKAIEGGDSATGFDVSTEAEKDEASYQQIVGTVHEAMKKFFRPEFLNRIDEIVVFRQLTREEIRVVIDLLMIQFSKLLAPKGLTLVLSESCKDKVLEDGYNPSYGARSLRRAIDRLVRAPLANEIIAGTFRAGDQIIADMIDGKVVFSTIKAEATAAF